MSNKKKITTPRRKAGPKIDVANTVDNLQLIAFAGLSFVVAFGIAVIVMLSDIQDDVKNYRRSLTSIELDAGSIKYYARDINWELEYARRAAQKKAGKK